MGRFGRTTVQIRNLNPEVALDSMLLSLCPNMFVDSLCKKPPDSMDELHERAKGYTQMEEMSRFQNEVCHAGHKFDKHEAHTKANSHKSNKRHKLDKRRPRSKV